MGVNLSIKTSEWDPIIPNLKSKKFDVIISAMTITAAREEEVDFTRWYYKSSQAILVAVGNPDDINTTDDIAVSGYKIGCQAGTTSDLWTDDNAGDASISTYDSILEAIAALKLGQVDCVLGDFAVLKQDEVDSSETEVVATFSPENFGIACRTGDTDLVNSVNAALNGLLGADVNNPVPTDLYNIMYYKAFGVSATDVGYNGTATTGTIPTVEFITPKTSPGFELVSIFLAIPLVFLVKRKRK